MALAASQLGMRALAREARGGVIKLPVRPTIWIVTSSAPVAERTLVVVVDLVTSDALRRCTAVATVRMALFAAHGSVQSHQREAGEVVVEAHLVAPARLTVASGAISPHAAGMDVVCLVAAEAFLGQFLGLGTGRVASMAAQLFVFAVQRVLVLGEMVVFHWLPTIRLVAGCAVVTEAAGMRVFRRMTAVAGLRQLRLQVAVFMASIAGNLPVLTVQPKAGFLQMIKAGVLPAHRTVAVLASGSARTMVHVVGCVAGVASGGCTLEGRIPMASGTGHLIVRTQQRKFGLAVVKLHRLEAFYLVTFGAVGAELAKVNVVCLVAVHTGMRGIAVLFASLVARGTGDRRMGPFQRIVRLLVAERVGLEPDDVRRPTLVLAVAPCTARIRR